MNQLGVHSQGTTGGEDRVFIIKVSVRPHRCQESDPDTVAAPLAQRQKVGEYRAKIPFTVAKKASSKPGTCLAQRAQYLWRRSAP